MAGGLPNTFPFLFGTKIRNESRESTSGKKDVKKKGLHFEHFKGKILTNPTFKRRVDFIIAKKKFMKEDAFWASMTSSSLEFMH